MQYMKNLVFCTYINQIARYYHLSMARTYKSKEEAIIVVTGKMLKDTHADLSLRVKFLSFSNLKFNFKC